MKKCPYCAEEIQDAAIVCRHCGRDLAPAANPPVQAKPTKKKQRWLLPGAFLIFLLCCVVLRAVGTSGTPTPTAEQANEATGARSVVTVTITSTHTPTPPPELGMDLAQFVAKYDSLTDLQKKDFEGQSVGKWVDWSGEIVEVQSDSRILVNIPNTLLSAVSLKGVSEADAAKLTKGATIHFTGRISMIAELLGLFVYVEDVQIMP